MKFRLVVLFVLVHLNFIAQDTNLVRGPYLQQTSQSSTFICWKTDSLTITKVFYGTTSNNLTNVYFNNSLSNNHFAFISGLQSNTKYYYTVCIANVNYTDTFYFYTMPPNNTKQKLRFLALGDCGSGYPQQENLKQAINYYNKTHLDGILLLGDNAYENGLETEYQTKFFDKYKTDFYFPYTCIYPSPGNHDYSNNYTLAQNHLIPYYDIFKTPQLAELGGVASNHKEFYSFNYGGVHFISLDSYGIENNQYHLWDTLGPQYNWLKSDLANDHSLWKIVYFHHPPFTMGSHNSDTEQDLVEIRNNIARLLEKYNVDLVLNGHSHNYERSWLQHGHYNLESSFSKIHHIVDSSSARYDGTLNSCPYTKDSIHDKGTVYVVAGEAGKLGYGQASYPHDSKYFSDYAKTGALFLEVEGNRLDAYYLEADSLIHDHFTIFKNVNRNTVISDISSQTATITASWPGNYYWLHNSATSQTQVVNVLNQSRYVVRDSLNCLRDTFFMLNTQIKYPVLDDINDLVLYPNPTHGKLFLTYLKINGNYETSIYSQSGNLVTEKIISFKEGKAELNLSDLQLTSAYYFIKLKISEKTLQKPFFIDR